MARASLAEEIAAVRAIGREQGMGETAPTLLKAAHHTTGCGDALPEAIQRGGSILDARVSLKHTPDLLPPAPARRRMKRSSWRKAMRRRLIFAMMAGLATPLCAQSLPAGPLAGLAFLVGDWDSGAGQVADTGGTSKGRSTITAEAGGNVLLRRDHTDLFDKAGRPVGSFEQVMMIYPEHGTIHADYSDGRHVIHYVNAEVTAGHGVMFTSAAQATGPTFRLSYTLADPTTLAIAFEMAPPGSSAFHPIATGSLERTK